MRAICCRALRSASLSLQSIAPPAIAADTAVGVPVPDAAALLMSSVPALAWIDPAEASVVVFIVWHSTRLLDVCVRCPAAAMSIQAHTFEEAAVVSEEEATGPLEAY